MKFNRSFRVPQGTRTFNVILRAECVITGAQSIASQIEVMSVIKTPIELHTCTQGRVY